MFLDAYYKILFISTYCGAYYYVHGDASTYTSTEWMLYDTTGTQRTKYYRTSSCGSPFFPPLKGIISQTSTDLSYSSKRTNIIVGTGTTPVTSSDYKIENEITKNLICDSISLSYNYADGKIYIKKTMTNTGSETITINEIGMTANNCSYDNCQFLVYREVLETPIVVAPGETFTVTITHHFTMPE